jgi:uncharacterized protein
MEQALLFTGEVGSKDDDCACPDKAFILNFAFTGQEIENDCACPDHGLRLDCPRPQSHHLFTITPQTHTQPLPASFFMAYSPYAPGGPSVLNQVAWDRWQTFAQPQPIQEEIDHDLLAQGLLQPVEGRWRPQTTAGETLTAWLHVTNACNLDCPYCYVQKSSERMSEATGLHTIRQIFATAQQNGFRRVKLKYAGGEATLHFKLVQRLHEEAVHLAQQTGLALQEVVLSNGVHLRPADADWLARSGVKLMISLDGVGEVHDQQRPLKGGGKTFAQVERTVDEVLRPRNIRPDITITLTGLNANGAADAARWALQRDLPVSLNFYRPNLLSASRTELALEEEAIIKGMLAAYAVFADILPERPFFNGLLDRVQAEAHAHTCGVQHSYLVITHTGKLAQCQMHLDQPVQQTVNGDLIPLVAAGPIQNLSVDEKEGCRTCTFRYRCTGGCPLETFRATGRWDVQSPHCHIYQQLLPQASRLEALRLLKVHGHLP